MLEKDADPKNLPISAKAVISPFRSALKTKSKFPKLIEKKNSGVAYYSSIEEKQMSLSLKLVFILSFFRLTPKSSL